MDDRKPDDRKTLRDMTRNELANYLSVLRYSIGELMPPEGRYVALVFDGECGHALCASNAERETAVRMLLRCAGKINANEDERT